MLTHFTAVIKMQSPRRSTVRSAVTFLFVQAVYVSMIIYVIRFENAFDLFFLISFAFEFNFIHKCLFLVLFGSFFFLLLPPALVFL